jgi:hypothetical protein
MLEEQGLSKRPRSLRGLRSFGREVPVGAITFRASIGDRETAIQRSGKLEGGGRVTFDVPEADLDALAALMPLVVTRPGSRSRSKGRRQRRKRANRPAMPISAREDKYGGDGRRRIAPEAASGRKGR